MQTVLATCCYFIACTAPDPPKVIDRRHKLTIVFDKDLLYLCVNKLVYKW